MKSIPCSGLQVQNQDLYHSVSGISNCGALRITFTVARQCRINGAVTAWCGMERTLSFFLIEISSATTNEVLDVVLGVMRSCQTVFTTPF
jgi:hypothetical protein